MDGYNRVIKKFGSKNILVIGDIILDQYVMGNVSRISPEAPVPVVVEQESFYTPGGAANVANNLRALGAKVALAGRVGDDAQGKTLRHLLKKENVDVSAVFIDKKLPTICKTRVFAKHQQIVRIDRERTGDFGSPSVHKKIQNYVKRRIADFDAVIISDYGKGIITPGLVNDVRGLALASRKIITVDPKVEHFSYYRNVTAITPNLKEAENAIRDIKINCASAHQLAIRSDRLEAEEDINAAGEELRRYLDLGVLLITLGEHGMRLFEKGKKAVSIKTAAREVFDVSGAGDAVISAFTLGLASGASKRQAAEIANCAGGIVVGKMGAVAVSKNELIRAVKGLQKE